MFKRQPSMDQAEIDALVAGDVGKSKAIRELAQRNAGANATGRHDRVGEDALGLYERGRRRAELAARGYAPHPYQSGLRFRADEIASERLELPGLNPGYHVHIPGLLESSREMENELRPDIDRLRRVQGARFEWFGAPWDSPICRINPRRRRVPEGRCFGCETPFSEDDQGLALVQTEPEVTTFFHRVCFPVWLKTKRLSLDLGEVVVAIAEQRVVRASDRASRDRMASQERLAELERANEPGDAWESPSWEEP